MIKVIVIALLILAGVGPFFINGRNGSPLLTLEDLKPDFSVPDLGSFTGEKGKEAEKENALTTVYKWQDKDGSWHFSNRAEDAAGAALIQVDGNINVIPEFKAPTPATAADSSPQPSPLAGTTIGQGLEALNKAKELQTAIDSRKAEIDKVLKQAKGG